MADESVIIPSYYNKANMSVIDIIDEYELNFNKGNIIKYIWRWRDKGGVEDLRKASVYLDWLINAAEEKENDYGKAD